MPTLPLIYKLQLAEDYCFSYITCGHFPNSNAEPYMGCDLHQLELSTLAFKSGTLRWNTYHNLITNEAQWWFWFKPSSSTICWIVSLVQSAKTLGRIHNSSSLKSEILVSMCYPHQQIKCTSHEWILFHHRSLLWFSIEDWPSSFTPHVT